MSKNLMAIISFALFALLVSVAIRAWRLRIQKQQRDLSEPLEALEFFGESLASASGFYVATTYAANHLERIAAFGLGARGKAQIMVFAEGVLIVRTGERPLAIDRSQLRGVELGQTTIDKSVEPDGLLQIDWQLDTAVLTTHMRLKDLASRQSILEQIRNITTKEVSK